MSKSSVVIGHGKNKIQDQGKVTIFNFESGKN